ncbi:TPA: hypothetical protein PTV74_002122 [Clostridium botulinum]|nr:hypothetical protein [Clostridium botulinum]HDK7193291.1 hypothetical protein [Clostridium botulinum]HDK7205141.1 hypothetical protein [Clostridium botulinum]HDK7209161.1 hypothetical protein [Clostridium botulinum]HDK7264321.1 hypothetical protein [Clostridium botulinum]
MKLSEIIKKIEEKQGIKAYYLHHEYDTGELELNIEFDNNIADKILKENNIKKTESCAFWE